MTRLLNMNIPDGSCEDELERWVESHGFHVESAEIVRDRSTGLSRGFGFVTLTEEWRLDEVIDALNGQWMGGRVLTVNAAVPVARNFQADRSPTETFRGPESREQTQ